MDLDDQNPYLTLEQAESLTLAHAYYKAIPAIIMTPCVYGFMNNIYDAYEM